MPRRSNDPAEHEEEIRLSAFLRLLNSRDTYRRVYQMRIDAEPMLDLLWKNPMAPRSVTRCLMACADRLHRTREDSPSLKSSKSTWPLAPALKRAGAWDEIHRERRRVRPLIRSL